MVSQDTETLKMALVGFEIQRENLDKKIASLRDRLGIIDSLISEPKRKNKISAAGRANIAAAQKRRWAAVRRTKAKYA